MSTNDTGVHLVSNADLRAGRVVPDGFEDPEAIAGMAPSKRSAVLSNPLLGSDDEPVQILGTVGRRIVGRLDLVAGSVETAEGSVPCFWGSSFYVAPAARGRGLGATLLGRSEELHEVAAACGPSRLSHPVYVKRGYLDIPMSRYVLVRRTRPLVEHWLGSGLTARVAAAVADTGTSAQHGLLRLGRSIVARGLVCEGVETCPVELDPRLREPRAPLAMHRSAAWLDWIVRETFLDDGSHRRALFLVRDRRGEVVAYFLVKARVYTGVTEWKFQNLDLGSLIDWRIFEPGAVRLEQLIFLALGAVGRWRVAALEVCVPPDAGVVRLGRWGFRRVREQHVMVRPRDGGVLDRPDARQVDRWSVRPGEGDYAFS